MAYLLQHLSLAFQARGDTGGRLDRAPFHLTSTATSTSTLASALHKLFHLLSCSLWVSLHFICFHLDARMLAAVYRAPLLNYSTSFSSPPLPPLQTSHSRHGRLCNSLLSPPPPLHKHLPLHSLRYVSVSYLSLSAGSVRVPSHPRIHSSPKRFQERRYCRQTGTTRFLQTCHMKERICTPVYVDLFLGTVWRNEQASICL